MAIANVPSETQDRAQQNRTDTTILLVMAGVVMLGHLLTNSRYGFHRDELQVLSDALHLDWGFVPYPPFTPFVERISVGIFGYSLVGLRLFSVIAQATVIVITGLAARELGGGRVAQVGAALAVALSPLSLFEGTEFQYTTFDYLWWVLLAYFVIRLLKSENPRWWIAIGAVAGLGLETKYTMAFLLTGVAVGLLLTRARRFLLSGWFWAGTTLALLIFLPNLIWQIQHHFISLAWLRHIHARDVRAGRANGFFRDQFLICTNPAAAPLWIAGLIFFLRDRRYRMLAWMYLVPLALLVIGRGRGYYLGAGYAVLIAMGAAEGEKWIASLRKPWPQIVEEGFLYSIAGFGIFYCAMVIPIASSGPLKRFALRNNENLREEIGWHQLARTVAKIRDSLPPQEQAHTGIVVGNYGEQGAIEILGRAYHLPPPISMTNSGWLRGYPHPPPSTLIVVGFSREGADKAFTSCALAGHNGNSLGVRNEESAGHPDIFLCGPPRLPWPEFWKDYQSFG